MCVGLLQWSRNIVVVKCRKDGGKGMYVPCLAISVGRSIA